MRIPYQAAAVLLLLAVVPAQARVLQPRQPAGPSTDTAESGGQALRRGSAGPGCAGATADCALAFRFGDLAWFSLSQIEMLARMNAVVRIAIAAEQPPWRAPRVAGRVVPIRRILIERRSLLPRLP